jgi:hypothetical protein
VRQVEAQDINGIGSQSLPIAYQFKRIYCASVRAGQRQHCRTRTAIAAFRRSRRDFKEPCQPNGGKLMVGGRSRNLFNAFLKKLQA